LFAITPLTTFCFCVDRSSRRRRRLFVISLSTPAQPFVIFLCSLEKFAVGQHGSPMQQTCLFQILRQITATNVANPCTYSDSSKLATIQATDVSLQITVVVLCSSFSKCSPKIPAGVSAAAQFASPTVRTAPCVASCRFTYVKRHRGSPRPSAASVCKAMGRRQVD
jgi:hypothetical protein